LPASRKSSFFIRSKRHENRVECGFSLIELLIVVAILCIIFSIAIPHFLSTRSNAQAAGAKGDQKTIHSAELAYYSGGGQGQYGTFPQLETLKLLPSQFSISPMVYNRFNYTGTMTFGPNNETFWISSVPPLINANTPAFFIDDSGSIRYSDSGIASVSSTPVGQ
jgi:prepilin-type N-terminal cleavage/methylation domain-containing protein